MIGASLALEAPSFGLSTLGVIAGVIVSAGGLAVAAYGGFEFGVESQCF